jgi:hypothetical protein
MRIPSAIAAAGFLLLASAPMLRAQTQSNLIIGGPVRIAPKPPGDSHRFRGEVIAATNSAITVRDGKNERMIRTFTYSPALHDKMRAMTSRRGYQPGDKVSIHYHQQHNEAYAIDGKPSAPR